MPHIGFSTLSCPDWSWRDIVALGPQYGYDGVEVRLVARETDLLQVPELRSSELPRRRRELSDAGFEVCGLASSVRFDEPEPQRRTEQLRIGRAYVDLAAELGSKFVRVFGDVLPPASDPQRSAAIARVAEGLERLGEYAASAGVLVLLETHGDFLESAVLRDTLSLVTQPAVGVLWDTHHPWRFCGEPVRSTFETLRPWLRHTHWKDSIPTRAREIDAASEAAAREAQQLMSGHRHADYVLFGEGEFPTLECLRLLRGGGYDGWLCYEWEKMWHPEIEEPEVALPPFPAKMRQLWELAGTV
jgi:sugar phosphate isomerase/epimerase